MPHGPFQIDVDVQLMPGRGYAASYVITEPDGTVVHRRLVAKRFHAYSEAMGCALDLAKATATTLELVNPRLLDCHASIQPPTRGPCSSRRGS